MQDAFRPKRMSKVSVTGSKAVMEDVVAVAHDMNLLHVTDYDGSWAGFEQGDPAEGADELSEKLVTVRSLESILDVDAEDAGPTRLVTDEAIETELEEIRQRVNELDDRRDELENQLRAVDDRVDAMAPFAALGVDLDLLQGYDTLQVAVGEGDEAAVREALSAAESVDAFELFTGDGVVAAFARPAAGADGDALEDALVGVQFSRLEVPSLSEGPVDVDPDDATPETYLEALEARRNKLESQLDTVENELEDEKLEAAGFLLAVEEKLSIEVQKREAPLSFATTDNAFIGEGWLPSEDYDEFASAVETAVDGRVEIEELERADYDEYGHPEHAEHTEEGAAAADGGTTMSSAPPVVQDNPAPSEPFELLVNMVDRPKYSEFDPTVVLFLTFPAFFGFMIGDVGYGIAYMAIGYVLWTRFDSAAIRSLGGVALWAGGFTALFGVLYGEFLGLHFIGELYGGPVMHKGLIPSHSSYAIAWIVVTTMVGILHVALSYAFAFAKEIRHGLTAAVLESGSWALMMFGLWTWIFSRSLGDVKPGFLVGKTAALNGHPLKFGFPGFPEPVGVAGLVAFVVGLGMIFGAGYREEGTAFGAVTFPEFVEAAFMQVLVRALSYTRMAAVLLAKAGMAFVVNLLVFGAYAEQTDHGRAFHFLFFSEKSPASVTSSEKYELIFAGLVNGDGPTAIVVGIVGGGLVFLVGHLVVLGLGVTSAGLQAVRLEYVEFFDKFYEGGGEPYEPFGYERTYTTED